MEGTIRKARESDYENLYPLMEEVYLFHQRNRPDYFIGDYEFTKEQYLATLEEEKRIIIVYEKDGLILGYVSYELIEKHQTKKCHIHEIGVSSECQGQGIGKILYAYVEEKAKENQAKVIELSVFTFNQKAIAFYEAENMKASKIIYEKEIGEVL